MVKITLIALILAAINSQILNDSDGSVGQADHQATGNAASILGGFGGKSGFLPLGGVSPAPVPIGGGGFAGSGGSGPGTNKQNTQTKADSGLAQLVFSGSGASLLSAPIFSNENAFGDDAGGPFDDSMYNGCESCECPECYVE
jgi:hypothetical protein